MAEVDREVEEILAKARSQAEEIKAQGGKGIYQDI